MKQALLAVSLGAVLPQARAHIQAVEQALQAELPQRDFFHAFTSPVIRKTLAGQGEAIPDPEEALRQLKTLGYEDIIVQPTHILYGLEYEKLQWIVNGFTGQFQKLILGKPLLAGHEDLCALAEIVTQEYHPADVLVLLGHGTEHPANMVYPALQTALRLQGSENTYVGTIKSWPGLHDIIEQLQKEGRKEILLAPLMLTAGGHTLRDIAGENKNSWKSRLEAASFSVTCHMEGLGILPAVQKLYQKHLREIETQRTMQWRNVHE